MKPKSIKIKQVESLLLELIPEALSSLTDNRINALGITDIDCSKGKYNATVYINPEFITEEEKREILRQLRKAKGSIKSHCLNATNWFRCPDFDFKFDEDFAKRSRMEKLFKEIEGKKDE